MEDNPYRAPSAASPARAYFARRVFGIVAFALGILFAGSVIQCLVLLAFWAITGWPHEAPPIFVPLLPVVELAGSVWLIRLGRRELQGARLIACGLPDQ